MRCLWADSACLCPHLHADHQSVRSQQMARVQVITKCLWGSPREHCEPWLHLYVSQCLRGADQPWQIQYLLLSSCHNTPHTARPRTHLTTRNREKGLMLLHCWMLGPPPGSLLSSPIPLEGEPIVNELPFVMQLLSAPQVAISVVGRVVSRVWLACM